MNRYFLHFEVNRKEEYNTTFVANNTEFLYQIALEHCKRLIKEYAPDIDTENASIFIKQFSFLGEIKATESENKLIEKQLESKKAPSKQIEQVFSEQNKQNEISFLCECGAKFPTVQAKNGHKKGCKI